MITQSLSVYTNRSKEIVSPIIEYYGNQQAIYHQGRVSGGLFLLKSGSVKLQRVLPNGLNTIIRIVTEGEIFGEFSLPNEPKVRNSCFAIALEKNTEVENINMADLLNSEYWPNLVKYFSDQASNSYEKYEKLLSEESEARVKFYMKDLALRIGRRFGTETLLKINLTHQEWAILSDTSRQTVTQTLSSLKKQGIITYSRNRILFRNLETF